MKETDDIERLFQESFEDFEATPPASVKTAVDRAIAQKNGGMWWLFAVLFLLTTTALIGFFLFDTETIQKSGQTQMAGKSDVKEKPLSRSEYPEGNTKNQQAGETERLETIGNPTNRNDSGHQAIASAKEPEGAKQSDHGIPVQQKSTKTTQPKASVQTGKPKKAEKTGTPSNGKSSGTLNGSGENGSSGNIHSAGAVPGKTNGTSDEASNSTGSSDEATKKKEEPKPFDEPAEALKDSLAANLPDSRTSINNSGTVLSQNLNPTNNGTPKWITSFYLGPELNPHQSGSSLKISPSIRTSFEINRSLIAGYGLNTGLGYYAQQENYRLEKTTINTYTTVDSIPVYHPVDTDSIIGYQHYTVYDQDTMVTSQTVSSRVSTVFIPVYISKHFEFNQKWGLLVNAGAVFRISAIKAGSTSPEEPEPVQYKTGIMLSGRLHGTYRMGSWMFSAGLNCGYYVKPPLQYQGLDKSRYFLSPQVGIHYRF